MAIRRKVKVRHSRRQSPNSRNGQIKSPSSLSGKFNQRGIQNLTEAKASDIIALQRIYGNQLVMRMLQGDHIQREGDESTPKEKDTGYGKFLVYSDDFIGPLEAPERGKEPWPIRKGIFDQLDKLLKPIKEATSANVKITGSDDFKQGLVGDLAWLMTQPVGIKLIKEIVASGKNLTINESNSNGETAENWDDGLMKSDGKPGPGSDVTVEYNPGKTSTHTGEKDWMKRPPAIGLAHELIHAWADMKGITDRRGKSVSPPGYERQAVGLNEFEDAILSENSFRAAFGIPLRPRY
jgi:hypothetical protein